MTREQLFGLSDDALLELADKFDVDLPEGGSREQSVELVHYAIEEARLDHDESNNNTIRVEERKYSSHSTLSDGEIEAADREELPDRYNETRMLLLVRDPAWAYVYWDVRDEQIGQVQEETDFEGLFLRIVEMDSANLDDHTVVDSFEVPVQLSDKSRYINLPRQETSYYTELLACLGERHVVLCRSNAVGVPRGGLPDNVIDESSEDPREDTVLALSGLESLNVSSFGHEVPQRIISLIDRYAE